jgi:8-oxo-dGTP diphosphatase
MDRHCVVDHAAEPGRHHRPSVGAAILVGPPVDFLLFKARGKGCGAALLTAGVTPYALIFAGDGMLVDFAWRTALRLAFPLARIWWRLTGARSEGALVAVYVGAALLLVRVSYRTGWHLPGGNVLPGETPVAAARRELAEEIGLAAPMLRPAGEASGFWDGRRDRVHFFELRLMELPELKLDNREIVEVRLISPDELPSMMLTGASAAYLSKVDNPPR